MPPCRLVLAGLILGLVPVVAAGQPFLPGKDQHGDPLPAGAVARIGTVRWHHDSYVDFASFLPDGKRVITVGDDMTIRVWEFPSGKEVRRITLAVAAPS